MPELYLLHRSSAAFARIWRQFCMSSPWRALVGPKGREKVYPHQATVTKSYHLSHTHVACSKRDEPCTVHWNWPAIDPQKLVVDVKSDTFFFSSPNRTIRNSVICFDPENAAQISTTTLPQGFVQDLALDSQGNLLVSAFATKGKFRSFVHVFLRDQSFTMPKFSHLVRYNIPAPGPSSLQFVRAVGLCAMSDKVYRIGTSMCEAPLQLPRQPEGAESEDFDE